MCNLKSEDKKERKCCYCWLITIICFAVSVLLLVGAFLVPPTGVIDGSVLTAVGELVLFPVIIYGFRAIELGLEVRIQKGDTSLEIHKEEHEHDGQ